MCLAGPRGPTRAGCLEPVQERRAHTPEQVEQSELLSTLQTAIGEALTSHQQRVLVAVTLNGVPIDVLAEHLDTTRGALYKTMHDARQKLRAQLAERELSLTKQCRASHKHAVPHVSAGRSRD